MNFFQQLTIPQWVLMVIDLYIAWVLVYAVLKLLQTNVRAIQIVKGIILLYVLNLMSQFFELSVISVLIDDVMTWGIVAIIIIFQPEIRTGLESVGRKGGIIQKVPLSRGEQWVSELLEAVKILADERTGALIVLENQVSLREISELATPLESIITSELLRTIFRNKTPLHDGAVIIRDGEIACAGAILPATTRDDLPQTTGTRHRAAIGVSEMSDSLTIVVSEETGQISMAFGGNLERYDKYFHFEQAFKQMLELGGVDRETTK